MAVLCIALVAIFAVTYLVGIVCLLSELDDEEEE